MKTVAVTALIMALLIPFAPSGLGVLFFTCAVLAALAFKAYPVISGAAFSINLLNTLLHVPGAVFPASLFQGQVFLVHPEVGVHWIYLAGQIPVMAAAFYLLLTKDEPEQEDFIEGLKKKEPIEKPKTHGISQAEIKVDIPEYRTPPETYHVKAE